MELVISLPELLTNILFQSLSVPVKNREIQWILRMMSVSRHFHSVCTFVLANIKTLPMPILQRLPKTKLPQFGGMRKFSSRSYPHFDNEVLSSVRNIESLVIYVGEENDVDSSLLLLLTNLRALDIRSFSGNFGLEELPCLTNLTSLTLHYTHARNEHLVRLTNLTRLHFDSAPLINSDLFSTLTKLTNLDMGYASIGTESRISVNTGLEKLTIYGDNRLKQMELSRFPNLTKLKVMDVLHFEGFENLSSLKSLSITLQKNLLASTTLSLF